MLHTVFNTSLLKIAKNIVVVDSGATDHFVLPGKPVTSVKLAQNPLKINLPDCDCLTSTHTCKLDIPWLPNDANEAHIVPGLAHASLISIKVLCDAGCKVIYDDDECHIYYDNKVVWLGKREPNTGIWILRLTDAT